MRIHFIAIGGSVMHNLAISLAEQGHQITGSDDQIVEPSRSRLHDAGLLPFELGWYADKITEDLDAVILGMHAEVDNPELTQAQRLNIKIYSFPEFVYQQSINKNRVVIAGTYGKTTIMSMVMHVLKKLGREFDYLVGAHLEGFDSLIKLTPHTDLILIEGDEYFSSSLDNRSKFLFYHPNIALISGVEWDNFRTIISEEDYYKQFESFIKSIAPKGTLIYNKDNVKLKKIIEQTASLKINRHGYKMPEYTINKGVTYLNVCDENIPLEVFGKFNLSNISGAYTVCEWLGITRNEFYREIGDFKSSIRYLEFVAGNSKSVVYQDFGHTPSKLKASIHAVKEQFPKQDLVTIIELNAYESLEENSLLQYKSSMDESDYAVAFVKIDTLKDINRLLININLKLEIIFNHRAFKLITNVDDLEVFLNSFKSNGYNLLFISSSNYSGLNMASLADKFLKNI